MNEAAATLAVPPPQRLRKATLLCYGFGAVAYGVKDSGFGTFLLLFYNQVLGLPAASVGFAIMCALLIDALIDPAVGFFSDRTRSRWGRRHPWMYASLVPITLGWVLLWSPPVLSGGALLGWLFVGAVLIRTAVSCYEVPSVALTPELSGDYDERTRIMAYRYLFGWAGGLTMLATAYLVFLAPTAEHPNGLLDRGGYGAMGIAGAMLMGMAILVSAVGTHREIPNLPNAGVAEPRLGAAFRELGQTVGNRAFAVLLLAGLAHFTGIGVAYAISNYLYSYVWGFQGVTFFYLALSLFAGATIAFFAAPRLGRRADKGKAAAIAAVVTGLLAGGPYWLRLAGLFPEPGDPATLPLLFGMLIASTATSVTMAILASSMMADVVEDSEAKTRRRSEGVFFAGWLFVQKCTSGVGIFLAGLILSLTGFPADAQPGAVPAATIDRLILVYAATIGGLALLAALAFARFPFGRAEHQARLARLAERGAAEAPVPSVAHH